MRHPFPGPGIAIRILGEVNRENVELVRKADHIFISMIREAGIYDQVCSPSLVELPPLTYQIDVSSLRCSRYQQRYE